MPGSEVDSVVQHVRHLVAAENAGRLSDRRLLERFADERDESAFAALMQRHGAMVLNVCRRALHNEADAEDACQATFLVLARQARSIRNPDAVGSWLHGVALRASAKLRRHINRRQAREELGPVRKELPTADVSWREVQTILDAEIQRLPEGLRAPVLLCYLEGKAHNEGAEQLGWSLTTFRGRLERARAVLRRRLTGRGVTLSGALLATLLVGKNAQARLSAVLVVRTVQAVAAGQGLAHRGFSTQVQTLAQGVIQAMFWQKLKRATVAVLLLLAMTGLVGLTLGRPAGIDPAPAGAAQAAAPAARPAPPGPGKDKPKPVAPMTVSMTAQLYEVDGAFYQKLAKAKRLSLADLEKLEEQALNPPGGKRPGAPAENTLFEALKKQKLILSGKKARVVNGHGAVVLSRSRTVKCLPSPDQVRQGKTAPQKVQEGLSVRGDARVSADRRYVRLKLTEQSTEIEAVEKVKVWVGPDGEEKAAEVPFLKEAVHSRMRDVPDGGSLLVPVQYRPRALREKERWLVLCITVRIHIPEEEELLRK
jgi:RNA polymerase sigma factor (sigma-70 family)